ncbi:MAG: tetratricopeptide repeat protein [Chthoniobacterales bacterium]
MNSFPVRFSRRPSLLLALVTLTVSIANGQDPSIDRLLKKLPPPEKLVKPSVQRALNQPDPALKDPLVDQMASASNRSNPQLALELSRKLTARYPKSAGAECVHGIFALDLRQYREAGAAFRHSVALEPSFALSHLGLAVVEVSQNHFSAAIPPLKQVTRLEPGYILGWLVLSDCCLAVGQKQQAVEYARKATSLAPSSSSTWMHLARAEKALGHTEGALQALSRGADVSPDSASILATVGFGYINLNRIAQAIPPLQRAVRLAPKDYLVQAQLGFCLQATGQLDAGIQHLKTAASLAPKNYAPVWEHLGLAYQKKGMHREAVKAFEKATQISPGLSLAWRHLAEEYRALGQTAEADRAAAHARSAPSSKKVKG